MVGDGGRWGGFRGLKDGNEVLWGSRDTERVCCGGK